MGLGLDIDPNKMGLGLKDEEDEPQVRYCSPSTLPDRYLARESRANRSPWPIVWPLQIEIDLHNLPTAVSDQDRQNSRSKTLFCSDFALMSLYCNAALLQYSASGKPVKWKVLAVAVLNHAGVESLRGSGLAWAWTRLPIPVVVSRVKQLWCCCFFHPSPYLVQ